MGFSKEIKDELLVLSARHCCVCNRPVRLKMEVHHIKPREQGGKNTFENGIPLCFDCHCDAGHYNTQHPKGLKFSPEELRKHKTRWFQSVKENNIQPPKTELVELIFNDNKFDGVFKPIFIKETTIYQDRYLYKKSFELLGKDPMEFVNKQKSKNDTFSPYYDPFLNRVETYEEYMDFLNGDQFELDDIDKNQNCQPVNHNMPSINGYGCNKKINLSNCTLSLKLSNVGDKVLEDYKVYLSFTNVVKVDSVDKNKSFGDMNKYGYNVLFDKANKGEFTPKSNILVQEDSVDIDDICFRVRPETKEVTVDWEFFSRDYSTKGSLTLKINTTFEDSDKQKFVENPDDMTETIRYLPKLKFE